MAGDSSQCQNADPVSAGGDRQLQAQLTALATEVASLREGIGRNSRNSSRPPSSDSPGFKPPARRKGSGRKRAGQQGHPQGPLEVCPVRSRRQPISALLRARTAFQRVGLATPEPFCCNRSHHLSQSAARLPHAPRDPLPAVVDAGDSHPRHSLQPWLTDWHGAFCQAPPQDPQRAPWHRCRQPAVGRHPST